MVKQLNVEIAERETKRIKKDAIEMGVTLNEYASTAFDKFLNQPIADRRRFFSGSKRKTVGRKVCA